MSVPIEAETVQSVHSTGAGTYQATLPQVIGRQTVAFNNLQVTVR
jgi:hypothetical protein